MTAVTHPAPVTQAAAVAHPAGAEFKVEPYRGDDWAQKLARRLWLPMLAMGAMAVIAGLATSIFAGTQIANFFSDGLRAADDLGTGQAASAVGVGITFLGMGFILSGITMLLVNVVRTLRDAGRDVQSAYGAQALKLRKPWEGKALPHVMMLGNMVLIAGLVLGAVVATKLGSIAPEALATAGSGGLSGDDLVRFGVAQAILAWITPLRFVGLALIFGSIVLALRVIIRTLRYQSFRLVELAREVSARRAAEVSSLTQVSEARPATRRPARRRVS